MPRLIAFLRAINVGGHRVTMEELRGLFESLGLSRVETFIASGNVIFESRSRNTETLRRRIAKHLHEALGYEVATFLRTDSEVAAVARHKPFDDSKLKQAKALGVAFLAEPLPAGATKALKGMETEIDEFHAHGREVYWLCREKQSESTFSNAMFERTLRIQATFRGLKTVARLAEKYPPSR